ncbi:phage antirepressor [Paenibacillus sp. NPDC057967]|uniref:phage antirepressor n=1 Tax=Paenibacillus sp. NPDC057967 TaxID=3346293 RepID=UPI0036DC8401
MNQLFNYEGYEVRTVTVDGDPWFVAKDVCVVLGIDVTATRRLDDEDKALHSTQTLGGNQQTTVINESGLYSLILGSRKPEARAFKRWVTSDVLPTIRKHEMYATDSLLDDPDLLLKTIVRLRDERAARLAAEAIIVEQAPKVEYHDQILASEGTVNVSQIAKDYAIIAQDLNLILKHEGIQYKSGKQWLLSAKYHGLGYVKSTTELGDFGYPRVRTRWTQAGRSYIHHLLMGKGIRPEYGPDEEGAAYIAKIRKAEADRKKRRNPQPAVIDINVRLIGRKLG